jgi:hypothetical protein
MEDVHRRMPEVGEAIVAGQLCRGFEVFEIKTRPVTWSFCR